MSSSQKNKMPTWRKILIAVGLILIAALIGFVGYFIYSYYNSLPADRELYEQANSFKDVKLVDQTNYYQLLPSQPNKTGLILYPGAFADPRAYVAPFSSLAQKGITIFIIKSPLNFALLNPSSAKPIIESQKQIDRWFVAGHSLGGVTACEFAKGNQGLIEGLILLGSYCNGNAAGMRLGVLSIYASKDGLTETQDIEKSRNNLAKSTVFVEIPGGNHTQFGAFARLQPGDNKADILQGRQAELTNEAIWGFVQN